MIRWLLAVGLAAALAAAVGLDARSTYGARVSGDEPQYLLSALSLAEDGSLDISDEIAAQRFREFHEVDLDPQTTPLDDDGRQVSPHDPLLPVLLAVPMGVGGWVAAKATLVGLAGVCAALLWWVSVRRFDVRPWTAAVVAVAAGVSPPLAVYGTQVYPELPAAVAVLAVVAALTGARRPASAVVAVAGVCALPWLSVKYVPVAAVLGLALAARWRRSWRALAALGAAFATMAAAYLVGHRLLYGGWTAYATGDHFAPTGEFSVVGTSPNWLGRGRRLAGLLVDRRFGLVPWGPLWLAAVPAAAALARRRPPGWAVVLGAGAAAWVTATFVALTMHGWWWPGRQVVVVLPLVALAVAWWVDQLPGGRWVAAAAGAVGAANWAWVAWEASTDRRSLIVDHFDTTAPPYRLLSPLFPDGMVLSARDHVSSVLWWAALAALAVAGWRSAGGRRSQRHLRTAGQGKLPVELAAQPHLDPGGGLPAQEAASQRQVR